MYINRYVYISGWWFQPTSLKNMSSSIGMIIPFPTEWKKSSQVPVTTNQHIYIYIHIPINHHVPMAFLWFFVYFPMVP